MLRMLVVALLAMAAAGCPESSRHGADGDGDGDTDGDGDADPWCLRSELRDRGPRKVDLLFVIDNSGSMNQEQATLAEQFVIMARALLLPADPSAPGVDDLHVGVVSTDMGTGGYTIQTCSNPMTGDNGVLQNRDHGFLTGCRPVYGSLDCDRMECPWLSHSPEHPDDGSVPANDPPIWEDFGCVSTLGSGGCGFEQQLESSLAALTVQTGPGMPNEGFLRDDSLLAIIYVTDEDDCSTGNAEMFNPARDDYGTLNVRCALNPDELYPISRYYDAFLALRGGDLNRIVVAAITGVPVDGRWNPGDPIDQLRQLQVINPENPNELLFSCDTAMGVAFPPVRIAELVYAFGQSGILESICRQDWTPALQAIAFKIQEKLYGSCVSWPLPSDWSEACRVVETLDDGRECPYPAGGASTEWGPGWQTDLGLDANGHRRCEIALEDDDQGASGWFFDGTDPTCEIGRIRVTGDWVLDPMSSVVFECAAGCD